MDGSWKYFLMTGWGVDATDDLSLSFSLSLSLSLDRPTDGSRGRRNGGRYADVLMTRTESSQQTAG